MKGFSREDLNGGRPDLSTREAVLFCLDQLFDDSTHVVTDAVALSNGEVLLTYEELIGALLLVSDEMGRGRTP